MSTSTVTTEKAVFLGRPGFGRWTTRHDNSNRDAFNLRSYAGVRRRAATPGGRPTPRYHPGRSFPRGSHFPMDIVDRRRS